MHNIGSGFSFGEFSLKQKRTQRRNHIIAGVLWIRRMLYTSGDHVLRQRPRCLRRLHWLVLPLYQVASGCKVTGLPSTLLPFIAYIFFLVPLLFLLFVLRVFPRSRTLLLVRDFIVYITLKVLSVGFTTLPWYCYRPMCASTHLSTPRSTTNSRRPSSVFSLSRVRHNRKQTLNSSSC